MTSSTSLRFGASDRFELQPQERRLLVDGQPVTLGSRAFGLLLALAERPDRLLTKSELLDLVWPGLVVEESNLPVHISALRKLLGNDLIATVPGRGYRFATEVRRGAGAPPAPSPASPAAPPETAPPPLRSHLVGRDADIAAVAADLQRLHCLSIVGPGGVGKTSLARVVAERCGMRMVWVDLAPLADSGQVAVAALRAGGQRVAEGPVLPQLVAALGGQPVLLVLDNAEHLIDAVATLVAELLTALPPLRVLVTSQIVLQGAWEAVYRLAPLPLADADGAQALLAQRIAAADRRFVLDAASRPLLDAICRQLDGLPLALEMAASRVPLLGLRRVHDELAHRFSLLTAGRREAAARHRTLHAALDWSYGLLNAQEQRMFRALGAWAGGFTLDLAVAQMTEGADPGPARWDVIEHLAALVDRSLVVASSDDPPRYHLLETMRAYALEQLLVLGEEDAVRRRQGQVLLALMRFGDEEAAPGTPARRSEIENVGAALPWLLQHDFATAAELCTCSSYIDTFTRWIHQTSYWMEAMEPRLRGAEGQALPQAVRLGWWSAFARALVVRENRRATEVARHASALAREAADPKQLQNALIALTRSHMGPSEEADAACAELEALAAAHPAWPARRRLATVGTLAHRAGKGAGDVERKLALNREEVALALELGHPALADAARTNVLQALGLLKRHQEMVQLAAELLPRLEQQGSPNLPWAYGNYLHALLEVGRRSEFDALLPRALAHAWQARNYLVLEVLTFMLPRLQRLNDGARVVGLLLRLEGEGDGVWAQTNTGVALLAQLQAAFDEPTLQRLYAEGAALDQAGVLALVLGAESATGDPAAN